MLNILTQTQQDTAQKGASSASKSILPALNSQVMAPTYHGKACGSHATLCLSNESGSINCFKMHSIQFGYLEGLETRSKSAARQQLLDIILQYIALYRVLECYYGVAVGCGV
jgi:hypothetical protein